MMDMLRASGPWTKSEEESVSGRFRWSTHGRARSSQREMAWMGSDLSGGAEAMDMVGEPLAGGLSTKSGADVIQITVQADGALVIGVLRGSEEKRAEGEGFSRLAPSQPISKKRAEIF